MQTQLVKPSSEKLIGLLEFLRFLHKYSREFFEIQLFILVDVVEFDEPLGFLQSDLLRLGVTGGGHVWHHVSSTRVVFAAHLVLIVKLEFVFQL